MPLTFIAAMTMRSSIYPLVKRYLLNPRESRVNPAQLEELCKNIGDKIQSRLNSSKELECFCYRRIEEEIVSFLAHVYADRAELIAADLSVIDELFNLLACNQSLGSAFEMGKSLRRDEFRRFREQHVDAGLSPVQAFIFYQVSRPTNLTADFFAKINRLGLEVPFLLSNFDCDGLRELVELVNGLPHDHPGRIENLESPGRVMEVLQRLVSVPVEAEVSPTAPEQEPDYQPPYFVAPPPREMGVAVQRSTGELNRLKQALTGGGDRTRRLPVHVEDAANRLNADQFNGLIGEFTGRMSYLGRLGFLNLEQVLEIVASDSSKKPLSHLENFLPMEQLSENQEHSIKAVHRKLEEAGFTCHPMTAFFLAKVLSDVSQLSPGFIPSPSSRNFFRSMQFGRATEPTDQASTTCSDAGTVATHLHALVAHFALESNDQLCQFPMGSVRDAYLGVLAEEVRLQQVSNLPPQPAIPADMQVCSVTLVEGSAEALPGSYDGAKLKKASVGGPPSPSGPPPSYDSLFPPQAKSGTDSRPPSSCGSLFPQEPPAEPDSGNGSGPSPR